MNSFWKINNIIVFGFGFFSALYFGYSFFIPLTFGIILSMLLLPVCQKLEKWGIHRMIAIIISIFILILTGTALITVMASQVANFKNDLPSFKSSLLAKEKQTQEYISEKLDISIEQQKSFFKNSSIIQEGEKTVSGFLGSFLGFLTDVILILVYIIFFLLKREKYEEFIIRISKNNNPEKISSTLHKISKVSTQYLIGRLISILILSALYIIGLSALGLKHAVLTGSIAAFLTIVPYVGTFIGGLIPASAAVLSGTTNPLSVLAVVFFIQLIDDYFIEPYIIGGQINISPLAVIMAIVTGGILWGIAGMILFIPLFGMAKIIFDQVPYLQPLGDLIGPKKNKENRWKKRIGKFLDNLFKR
ncbi:MAG: AI-2E family transporter [Bacteroidetes bacterium]|nr:AI-2E family transporter [Bacteroidota bacterium]HET6242927.1 AI-2E family transporter [Bacteroidia bacterium]